MDRRSSEAGSWYAGSTSSLKQQIKDSFLHDWGYGKDPLEHPQERSLDSNFWGIISPHWGYVYRGSFPSHGYGDDVIRRKRPGVGIIREAHIQHHLAEFHLL